MSSSKMDEVARNRVWREQLEKERNMEGPLTEFQFNPKILSSVSVKPNLIDPRDFACVDKESQFSDIESKIKENTKSPQEKYEFPTTEAQEVGWMNERAWKNGRAAMNSKWKKGKGSCDVTQFADAYCTMAGCSPFADKTTR